MKIWSAITKAAEGGLLSPPPTTSPPPNHYVFVADAAGRRPAGSKDKTGVASVGIYKEKTGFGRQTFWQTSFTWLTQDNTAMYGMIGLLLPILIQHKQLKHQKSAY
jgi:hypothetical protein